MDWLFSVVRVAGASFPVASSLVQLNSEIESKALATRVRRLEDPVSFLHEDVPEASRHIYEALKSQDSSHLEFDEDFYSRFRRPIAALESQHYLECLRALNLTFPRAIHLSDPSYVMYMCALAEDDEKMSRLVARVDECPLGQWLDGELIKQETGVPLEVVRACFLIYESKGYGLCSKELGATRYVGRA